MEDFAALVGELAPRWRARREGRLYAARGRDRLRAGGAGRRARLPFVDQVLVTVAYLRLGVPQRVLGRLFGVSQSTISRAITAVRPLLAGRGYATPAGVRLHTLADVLAYAQATGFDVCLDGTNIAVRRPVAGRPGRSAFVNGRLRRNTVKVTVVCDQARRLLWVGAVRPGRMHDQSAVKTEGIDAWLTHYPGVRIWADEAYKGLARDHPGQVVVKQPPAPDTAPVELQEHMDQVRKLHCQQRIPVEQVIGALKQWKVLAHWPGPRHLLPEMITAVAGLVSDRTART